MDRSLKLAIHEAAAASTDPSRWHSLAEAIRSCTGALAVAVFKPAPSPLGGTIASVGHDADDVRRYFEYWIHRDPWILAAKGRDIFTQPGQILVGTDYLSDAEFLRTDYYEGHGRRTRSGHKMFLKIATADDPVVSTVHLTLTRPFNEESFGMRERKALTTLWPHLRAAVQTWAPLSDAQVSRQLGEPSLSMLPFACWVVRRDSTIDYANPAAEALHKVYRWLSVGAGRLLAIGNVDQNSLQMLLKHAASGVALQSSVLVRNRSGYLRQLTLTAAPTAASPLFAAAWPHAQVLLSISPPGDLDRQDWVPELAGLTAKQREVLKLLARGHDLRKIATELGIQLSTVKVHLKNICSLTGCHTQADLVRMAITGRIPYHGDDA